MTMPEMPSDFPDNKKAVWKFYWDCGRQGHIDSLFVATRIQILEMVDRYCYFGEVLGKHSEIAQYLEAKDFTFVSGDDSFVRIFEERVGSVGHNPLEHFEEETDE